MALTIYLMMKFEKTRTLGLRWFCRYFRQDQVLDGIPTKIKYGRKK